MRKAFARNAPASPVERFAVVLNTPAYQNEIVGVLLMNGALLKFRPGQIDFKLQKGNIFFNQERLRAILLNDQSVLVIENGKILSARIDDVKRFVRAPEPVAVTMPEPIIAAENVVEPESLPVSKKKAEELFLYKRIVDDLDQNSFAVYLEQRRAKLLRYASRDEYIAEEALQETAIKVLGLMSAKAEGKENGFCKTSAYFDTWMHSIIRNTAIKIAEVNKRQPALSISNYEGGDEMVRGTIDEESVVADIEPGVLSYHGHEDPLAFFERHERHLEMVELIASLAEQAHHDQRVDMLMRSSLKMSGLQEEFAGEIKASDYAGLAAEANIPVGTVRSKINRARGATKHLASHFGFNGAVQARVTSVTDEEIVAATHLMPEPG